MKELEIQRKNELSTKNDDKNYKPQIDDQHNKKLLLNPGSIFGELILITQKKWRHADIYALEQSTILGFSNNYLNKLLKVIFMNMI